MKIYIKEDNLITVDRLRDTSLGDWVNDAAIYATLYEDDGLGNPDLTAPVPNAIDIPFVYSVGSNGRYYGELTESAMITLGENYHLNIVGDSSGRDLNRWLRCTAVLHGGIPSHDICFVKVPDDGAI